MKTLVSIIIPIFNNHEIIHSTIQSILNQTFCDFEVICIDDASTDSSLKILKEFKLKDSRIQILSTNGEGNSFAKNLGLQAAKGEYILFFNPGNLMSENLLEYLVQLAQTHNSQITSCDYFDISERDFINFEIPSPKQKKEKITKLNSKKYLENLSSLDKHTFEKASILFNKLISKSLLASFSFNEEKYHSDDFAIFEIVPKASNIISSNQILICHPLIEEYLNNICFSYNDLEKIEFMQEILLYFKKANNLNAVKNTAINTLDVLYFIRKKLSYYHLKIFDKEQQKTNLDKKFNSIYKFLNSHFSDKPFQESEYRDYYKKYRRILKFDAFREKFYFFYPNPDDPFIDVDRKIEGT